MRLIHCQFIIRFLCSWCWYFSATSGTRISLGINKVLYYLILSIMLILCYDAPFCFFSTQRAVRLVSEKPAVASVLTFRPSLEVSVWSWSRAKPCSLERRLWPGCFQLQMTPGEERTCCLTLCCRSLCGERNRTLLRLYSMGHIHYGQKVAQTWPSVNCADTGTKRMSQASRRGTTLGSLSPLRRVFSWMERLTHCD